MSENMLPAYLKAIHIEALMRLASRRRSIPSHGYVDGRIAKTLLKHGLISDWRDPWHDNAYTITAAGLRQLEEIKRQLG